MTQAEKTLSTVRETWVQSLGQEDPLEKGMASHSSILPGGFHGQRNLAGYLAGYSPRGLKESDTTEQLTLSRKDTSGFCFSWCNIIKKAIITDKNKDSPSWKGSASKDPNWTNFIILKDISQSWCS